MSRRFFVMLSAIVSGLLIAAAPVAAAEPPGYEHFHTYAEMKAELDATVADHPGIAQRFDIGASYEGRKIWGIKISDNVGTDEDEPEVLFHGLTHARERLSAEMALHIVAMLTDGYGTDQRVTDIVNSREVWIVPMLNPDGAEFDFSGDVFHTWRKNRQPIPGSSEIGVDLNRQFGYMWGCCGGSSPNPPNDTYRGPAPWFAPEAVAYRDFVNSRVVGGRQQIRASISWHTAGRMVLWPYAFTKVNVPPQMALDDWKAFKALGQAMAATNGYKAQQGSDLYIVDGDQEDWAYHEHRIFSFAFEMAKGAAKRYYPTATETAAELANNEQAVLMFLEFADCPYRAAGLGASHCGPLNDDFEAARGWTFSSTGATGWERANPEPTSTAAGIKQRDVTVSGESALVTGAPAGGDASAFDVDGTTTATSGPIQLGSGKWKVKFRFTFAHDALSSADDKLRLSVVRGSTVTNIWTAKGKPAERNAAWTTKTFSLNAFAGQTIRLRFTAVDGATDNLVEAAIDNVRVFSAP